MGKRQTREERNRDYIDFFGATQEENATNKRNNSLVPERNPGFSNQTELGTTDFDTGLSPGLDFFQEDDINDANQLLSDVINENRAQKQTKGEKLFHGLGRVGTKTFTEFMKGLGYIGGAIPALIDQDITHMTDNFFVSAFQEMEDAGKEALPVYIRKEIEEGSLARQIWSPEFLATEGADGLGFLISALIPAGIISKIGIGAKIASSAKLAGKIDNILITGTQTFIESAAETDGVIRNLKSHWEQHKNADGTYTAKNADGKDTNYTQDQVDKLIGSAGLETMGYNSLLLLGPNALMTRNIFGKGVSKKNIFSGIDTSSPDAMREGLSKIVPWKKAFKIGATKGGISAGSEAFQELSQFAVEDYESKKGKAITNDNWIDGLIDGYIEGLTTIEGQKAMILGAILGIGPGAIGAYKKSKAETRQAKGLTELLANSTQDFKTKLHSVYKTNEDGSLFINPDTNKPEKDPEKITEMISSISEDFANDKYFQIARQNKQVDNAKMALSQMVLKQAYPYLQVEGGMDIWKEHVRELSEVFETEAADLGFSNRAEYVNYLTDIAEKSKIEYDNVRNIGPAFFGIKSKDLARNKIEKALIQNDINKFISDIEYKAVGLKVIRDQYYDQLQKINTEILENSPKTSFVDSKVKNAVEAITENIIEKEDDGVKEVKVKQLKKIKKQIQKNIADIGKSYEMLFDEKEQQLAFDNRLKASEELEKAVEEDNLKEADDRTVVNEFYKNLEDKGYNISKSEDGEVNDFGKDNVSLKDDNGEVYRIEKRFSKGTESSYFVLKNLDTKIESPLSVDNLKKLGLEKDSNIITKADFQRWVRFKKVSERNNERLEALSKLISDHNRTKKRFTKEAKELLEDLSKYEKELEFWNTNSSNFTQADVAKEISTLNDKISKINSAIKQLEDKKESLNTTLTVLNQFRTELKNIINLGNKEEFSFGIKLKELEAKLIKGDFSFDFDDITDSIKITEEWLEELYEVRNRLVDTIDELQKLIIQENAELRADKDWNTLSNEDRYLMSTYKIKAAELKDVKKQIKDLRKELNKLRRNKKLLIKYEKLNINLKTLEKRNRIGRIRDLKNNISNNQRKDFITSPPEQTVGDRANIIESSPKKTTPFSTVTAVYDINKKNADGTFEKTTNWKQAARWSRVMSKIPLDKLSNYSVRFVNNTQLTELGQEPPVSEDSGMYAVLFSNTDNTPYTDTDGLVYTGIANPETYFGEGYTSIDVTRLPEYKPYLKSDNISDKNPAIYDNKEYTSKESLEGAIIDELKNTYTKWRADILDKLNNGETLYSSIADISKGIARYGTENRKPKEVFNIKSIRVPRADTIMKSNGGQGIINVENGMPYVELENGQIQRVLNYRLSDLSEKDRAVFINKILKFMTLANEMTNHNFKERFNFKGTKTKIGLFGSNTTTGILDLFVNWGRVSNNERGIAIYPVIKGDLKSPLEIVFDYKGEKENMPLSNLIDKNGKVRVAGDPEIQTLVDFFEDKFMNVDYRNVNNKNFKNGFWMPKDWHIEKGAPVITYDKHSTYEEYVLENHLYTNVIPYNEQTDEIPNFVNQYITFDDKIKPALKEITTIPTKEPKPITETTDKVIPESNTEGSSILAENIVQDALSEPLSGMQTLMDNLDKNREAPTEKEEEVKCKPSKKPNFAKKKGLDNLKA